MVWVSRRLEGLSSVLGMGSGDEKFIEMGLFGVPFFGTARGEDENIQIGFLDAFDMTKNTYDRNVTQIHRRVKSRFICESEARSSDVCPSGIFDTRIRIGNI